MTLKNDFVDTDAMVTVHAAHHNVLATNSNTNALLIGAGAAHFKPPRAVTTQSVITTFGTGHGWAISGTGASEADNVNDAALGSQCAVVTTNGTNGAAVFKKISISPTIDLTGERLGVFLKVDVPTRISLLQLYLSSDNLTSNFCNGQLGTNTVDAWIDPGVWTIVPVNWADLAVTGSPTRSAINSIQFRISDTGSGAINVSLGGIVTYPEPANGVISLTFDDGWVTQYTNARPAMDKYGYPGTAFIIQDIVGTGSYMSLAQLQALQDINGWEIAAHAYAIANHAAGYDALSASVVQADMQAMKQWLITNNFYRGAATFAYPKGLSNPTCIALAKQYFQCARTIYYGTTETYPPLQPYRLRSRAFANTDSLATLEGLVDKANTNKEWLIITNHEIVTSTASTNQITTANFQSLMDYIATAGVPVRTIGDVLTNGV